MRIALLTSVEEGPGSVGHTLGFARALTRLDPNATVDVWTVGAAPESAALPLDQPRVAVCVVPFEESAPEGALGHVRRVGDALVREFELARAAYDVVHMFAGPAPEGVAPCVRTVHQSSADLPPGSPAVESSAQLVCATRALAHAVHSPDGRIPVVITDGVDVARFAAAVFNTPGRASWRGRIGGPYVLTLDGIALRSGSIDLLDGYAALIEEQPTLGDVRLAFAGDPQLSDDAVETFWQRTRVLRAAPVVLGRVGYDELPSLIAGAATLAQMSVEDGMPIAALQSLAAGVPVVARDLPSSREVLGDAVTYAATALSITDALEEVLTVPPSPIAGIELAASYPWEKAASAYLKLYRDRCSEDGVVEQQPDRRDRRKQRI